MAIKELYVKITGDDAGLQKALNSASKGMKEAAPGVDSFINKFVGPAGLAVALGAVAKAAIDTALEFDEANATIAKATGKTGVELARLNQSFRELQMRGIEQGFEESAGALAELSKRLEISGNTLIDTTQAVSDFADVTNGDMKEAVATTTVVMSKWNVQTKDMPGLMDKLYTASTKTGISVDALSSQLTTGAAQLQAMGFGLDESIALLSSFDRAGVNSGNIMGGMSIAIRKFADEGIDAQDGLKKLIASIKDAKSPQEAFAIGSERMGRSSVEFVTAVRAGKFNIEELTAAIQNSEGAVGRSAAASDTWADKLAVLQNKAKGLAAELMSGNIEAQAREQVAANIRIEFLKALETEENVYTAAAKVTGQYNISLGELQKIMAESKGILANESAMAIAAGLTAEEMAKQAATAKSLFERGTAQFQLIQMMKDEKVQIKLNEEARAAAAAAKIEADKLEAAAYTSKLEGVQFLIKNGYIPEADAARELVKVKQEEIDRITAKIKSSETATPQEIARLAELTKAVKEENAKIAESDKGMFDNRLDHAEKYREKASQSYQAVADVSKEANALLISEYSASDEKQEALDDNKFERMRKAAQISKDAADKILEDQKKIQDAAKITNDAFQKMGESLLKVVGEQALKGLKDIGVALASGGDSSDTMRNSLTKMRDALIDAMPQLLLQAGLMVLPTNLPLGVGLVVASGLFAIGGAAIKSFMDSLEPNGAGSSGTTSADKKEGTTAESAKTFTTIDTGGNKVWDKTAEVQVTTTLVPPVSGKDRFARGTSFAPGGLALVGERGPELMKLNQGAEIVPNHNIGNEKLGGASFNFYSPIAIDVGEAKRLFIQSQRDLAFAGGLV